eukprot:CAMPEP_0172717538 /NCGR_PEP_ID=MMETSP1074-20121228/71746_1 /TAXON_ID=2916 /ORGANISM="Ceratium fusus, Strain PA161109" /LENGTH=48 /DNA_ID= /DNA_START= /DNA_END= /DNA_ORIENTATION=
MATLCSSLLERHSDIATVAAAAADEALWTPEARSQGFLRPRFSSGHVT